MAAAYCTPAGGLLAAKVHCSLEVDRGGEESLDCRSGKAVPLREFPRMRALLLILSFVLLATALVAADEPSKSRPPHGRSYLSAVRSEWPLTGINRATSGTTRLGVRSGLADEDRGLLVLKADLLLSGAFL